MAIFFKIWSLPQIIDFAWVNLSYLDFFDSWSFWMDIECSWVPRMSCMFWKLAKNETTLQYQTKSLSIAKTSLEKPQKTYSSFEICFQAFSNPNQTFEATKHFDMHYFYLLWFMHDNVIYHDTIIEVSLSKPPTHFFARNSHPLLCSSATSYMYLTMVFQRGFTETFFKTKKSLSWWHLNWYFMFFVEILSTCFPSSFASFHHMKQHSRNVFGLY